MKNYPHQRFSGYLIDDIERLEKENGKLVNYQDRNCLARRFLDENITSLGQRKSQAKASVYWKGR
ncbi:MAG: hypothetical protein AVO38_11470 [delta proteobacterium ML8_D]|nr:MAG: hypothetical protein AVO38_11470 [delta proteobacterium ML8_D]